MTITTSDICDPFSQPLRIYIPQFYIWFKKKLFPEISFGFTYLSRPTTERFTVVRLSNYFAYIFPHIYLIFHWYLMRCTFSYFWNSYLELIGGINEFYFWSFLFFWMKSQLCGRITQPNLIVAKQTHDGAATILAATFQNKYICENVFKTILNPVCTFWNRRNYKSLLVWPRKILSL